jgi:phosphatidate cytidylyltransferase
MRARIVSAAVLAPIALALVLLGGIPFFLGVEIMCACAVLEGSTLIGSALRLEALGAWRWITVAAGAILLLGIQLQPGHAAAPAFTGTAVLMLSLLGLILNGPPSNRLALWSAGAATLVYIVGLGAHFILLRGLARGLGWTLLACLITWSTDIGAFFAGRQFGSHGFFTSISPKKTREGALGGALAGTIAAVVVAPMAGLHLAWYLALLVGATVSIAAQGGDLVESLLKREAGVKDSGTIIPGHGGVLDRIDSLLFAVAVTYYWRLLVGS